MAAAALPIAAIGMTLIGGMMSAGQAREQQYSQAQAATYNADLADRNALVLERNARIAEQNALVARQQTEADAKMQEREGRKRNASLIAQFGASGLSGAGSPLDVLADSAAQAEQDRQTIKYRGELRAMGYEEEAVGYRDDAALARSEAAFGRFSADNARTRGDRAFISGTVGAVARSATMLPGYSFTNLGRGA